jgi:serine/threonine-protein kinase
MSHEDSWFEVVDAANPDLRETIKADHPPRRPVTIPDEGLRIGPVLGEGGMGVVAVGDQGRLRRQVAVKRLKPGVPDHVAQTLLREAWVTGALEHPNIVPVHDLLADEHGKPQIVLKRIEGTEWEDYLSGAVPLPEEGVEDPLAWHLRVLMGVCNAVEFAHRQGVVHRDLKPENVMVGAFGEVYVLDWGIAMGLRPDPKDRFPLAEDQTAMVGTPVYMAPEMFLRDVGKLGPGTDVYLLAGMLYRLLAGHPPNEGDDLKAIRASAQRLPSMDPAWGQDLVALLSAGLALDIAARPSVAAFRRALQTHLDRRTLQALFRHAAQCFDRLGHLVAEPSDDPQFLVTLHDTVGAARFGLEEVLAGWPEHPAARGLLVRLHTTMAEFELGQGHGEAARVWLRRLEEPDPDLVQRVEEAVARAEGDRQRLAVLSADLDRGTGIVARSILLVLLLGVWVGFPVVTGLLGWGLDYARSGVQYAGVLGVLMLALVVFWRPIQRSRTNRGLWVLAFLSTVFTLLALFMGAFLEQSIAQALLVKTFVDACLACVAALLFEILLVPAALLYVGAVVVGVVFPDWAYTAGRLGTVALVLNALAAWPWLKLR